MVCSAPCNHGHLLNNFPSTRASDNISRGTIGVISRHEDKPTLLNAAELCSYYPSPFIGTLQFDDVCPIWV